MADESVAITAIVVSGVVGPTITASLTAWWTNRRQREDHEQELKSELRTVLDEGAHAAGRCKRAFERIYVQHRDGVPRDSPDARDAFRGRRQEMQEVLYCEDRIALRLGTESSVHQAYLEVVRVLKDLGDFSRAYEAGHPIEEAMKKQRQAHEEFDVRRRAYVAVAKELIGPHVTN